MGDGVGDDPIDRIGCFGVARHCVESRMRLSDGFRHRNTSFVLPNEIGSANRVRKKTASATNGIGQKITIEKNATFRDEMVEVSRGTERDRLADNEQLSKEKKT